MATTYDKASLVMIPSGVKEDKLYSIKPTSGDGDFTFSRGTDTATRVNSSGLIEKERANLLTYSNDFSNAAWTKQDITATSGQSGYDGSSDAWLLDKSAASGQLNAIISADVSTFSVYAKAGTLDWLRLYIDISGSNTFAFYNLNSGVVGTTTNDIDTTIESIGGGWYRCTLTAKNGGVVCRINPADDDGDVSGTSGNIYIQDAMLNEGLVAQPYIETTTAAVYEGITDNLPRLDYSGGASCPSLLLEPSRTNSITNSEYSAGFALVNFTRTQNSTTSPEGVINASTLSSNTTLGGHYFGFNAVAATSGLSYSGSMFVKKDTGRYFQLLFGSGAFGVTEYANFDLQEGVVTFEGSGATASIEPFNDGWYRVSITSSATSTASETFYGSAITSGTSARIEVHSSALSYFVYGVQLEENASYPTSYIPTYGTSASRAKDSALTLSVPDLIGQTEGTWYVEYTRNSLVESSYMVLSNIAGTTAGSYQNGIYLFHLNNLGGNFVSDGFISNVIQFGFVKSGGLSLGKHKLAIAYAQNDVTLYIDGVQIGTDTSANIPAMNFLTIGGGADVTGHRQSVNQALLFKTRLTNAELAALTTI
jgi:hypothetical protein